MSGTQSNVPISPCPAAASDGAACLRVAGHHGRHYRGAGRYFGGRGEYPAKLITMPADMWTRLDEIAARWGASRSATLARLVREAEMPRRVG